MASASLNLKVVIQHHSMDLINAFKKNLVEYSNNLWQSELVLGAVKNRVLEGTDVARSASELVSHVSTVFTGIEKPKQADRMKKLLKILESEGEMELVHSMQQELLEDFSIEIQPSYGNPSSSDQGRSSYQQQHPHSEPVDKYLYEDPYFTDSETMFEMEYNDPERQRLVGLPPAQRGPVQRQMVLPSAKASSTKHRYSDPLGYSNRRSHHNHMHLNRNLSSSAAHLNHRSVTARIPIYKPASSSPKFSISESEFDYQQSPHQSGSGSCSPHYEEQQQLCNLILIKKYEKDNQELKRKLDDKDREIRSLKHDHQTCMDQLNQQFKILQSHEKLKEDLMQRVACIESALISQHEKTVEHLNVQLKEEIDALKNNNMLKEENRSRKEEVFQKALLDKWNDFELRRSKAEMWNHFIYLFFGVLLAILINYVLRFYCGIK